MRMANLHDVVQAILRVRDNELHCGYPHAFEAGVIGRVLQRVDEVPTVEAEPVRYGRWIPVEARVDDTVFVCSECNREIEVGNASFRMPAKRPAKDYPYCHCGAKMDWEYTKGHQS